VFKRREQKIHEVDLKIIDEKITKRVGEVICILVEKALNTDEVKSEMQSRIKEGWKKLIESVTLQLQKEREEMIEEGHNKIR